MSSLQFEHSCSISDCSAGDCSVSDCSVGDCSVSDCSVCDLSVSDCSVGDCSVSDCSVGDCSVSDCSVGDCSVSDCSFGDCSVSDCSVGDCSVGMHASFSSVTPLLSLSEGDTAHTLSATPNMEIIEIWRLLHMEGRALKQLTLTTFAIQVLIPCTGSYCFRRL